MKRIFSHLLAVIFTTAMVTSCQQEENPNIISDIDVQAAESEAEMGSVLDDVDEITFYSMLSTTNSRIAEDMDSPLSCAEVTHDKDNKTIIIDYGDGCEDRRGRIRKGIIIITYTDHRFVPGALQTITFNDFYIDGKKIEGLRTRENISESLEAPLKYRITLTNGKVTWEDGSFATREAEWTRTRIRAANPINDQIIKEGNASGKTRRGEVYTVEITKPIVWKRGCLPAVRIFVPVEGIKVKTIGDRVITIDFGDGECDNIFTVTKDGVTVEREFKRH